MMTVHWDALHPLVLEHPHMRLIGADDHARLIEGDRTVRRWTDTIDALRSLEGQHWIGYLSYENRAADLLYEVISRRHKRKSLIITTNLAFSDWPTVFPNASCAVAMIDRLVERPEFVEHSIVEAGRVSVDV
jgi:hypothetical protein